MPRWTISNWEESPRSWRWDCFRPFCPHIDIEPPTRLQCLPGSPLPHLQLGNVLRAQFLPDIASLLHLVITMRRAVQKLHALEGSHLLQMHMSALVSAMMKLGILITSWQFTLPELPHPLAVEAICQADIHELLLTTAMQSNMTHTAVKPYDARIHSCQ